MTGKGQPLNRGTSCKTEYSAMATQGQQRDPVERFVGHVEFTATCWHWKAKKDHGGYGQFAIVRGRHVSAHRYAWETFVGPIPEGMELDHVRAAGCTSRNCVNPDHLEPVTHKANMERISATRTHCPHGHEYTEENTRTDHRGRRSCRACARVRREALRAGVPAPAIRRLPRATSTHCKRGHELSGENLYVNAGLRFCRACHRFRIARAKGGVA